MKHILFPVLLLLMLNSCGRTPPPEPWGPVPSPRQLAWQKMEFYAFVHFNINTFTNKEWGYGDESPVLFNPTDLDCRQWARVAKEAGMKGIILTAKHHDGFCLWPSAYTDHSVRNSPWKDGKGDVVMELAEACKEYGLKMGIYLSPWDRSSALYGTPEYLTYYRNQLRELLTNYGEIFEVWFDGANGGTGYYGGARENRKIDRKTYYDWPATRQIVRELQPGAVMFSDAGPDVRWVGNEKGYAGETNWSHLNRYEFYPGSPNYRILNTGQEDGRYWVPAECDVSIRPGWFYHPEQDTRVKTVDQLMDIYYKSVGRNASLLLNLPVDTTGRVNPNDVRRLKEFRIALDAEFADNLAAGKRVTATSHRGSARRYRPGNITDGLDTTYWCTDDTVTSASFTIHLGKKTKLNRLLVQEYIPLGQRVKAFFAEAEVKGQWQKIAKGTTIGYKRILRFPETETDKIRVTITASKACPVISNAEIYNAPVNRDPLSIVEVRKIWDRGEYNSFTDLVRFKTRWYCTFREGKHHAGGDQGKIRVIESDDGVRWHSVAFFEIPSKDSVVYDLRDPKITLTSDGRLMLSAGVSLYAGNKRVGMISKVAFSADGRHWGPLQSTNIENRWPWRPVWDHDTAWVVSYEAASQKLFLEKSPDGIHYRTITVLNRPENFPNEATLHFDQQGKLTALIRTEKGKKQAFLGTALPPYIQWSFVPLGRYIGGPDFLILSSGNFLVSGRMYIEGKPKTCVVILNKKGEMTDPLVLPSGGDTSYPGMVMKDGMLWLSYYSSHEGKAAIYLAKIKINKL